MSYTASDVARMLDVPSARVRAWVRAGFLAPQRGARGELRFSFQDLVLLRTAKGLVGARIPPRKVRRALARLREQLPAARPLSGVQIAAEGDSVVVRDGATHWNPESGQLLFRFEVADLARKVAPLVRRAHDEARVAETMGADEWCDLGLDAEAADPERARSAYRRALELEPRHIEAHVNLGRLMHESGQVRAAEEHYRMALAVEPAHAVAAFNLGVALEDLGRADEAVTAYEAAIAADPGFADAHFNAARLCERLGRKTAAIRHLHAYRKLKT